MISLLLTLDKWMRQGESGQFLVYGKQHLKLSSEGTDKSLSNDLEIDGVLVERGMHRGMDLKEGFSGSSLLPHL